MVLFHYGYVVKRKIAISLLTTINYSSPLLSNISRRSVAFHTRHVIFTTRSFREMDLTTTANYDDSSLEMHRM